MRGAVAIVKKELKTYFCSPLAYVVIGVFLFFMGVIFSKFVYIYQQYNSRAMFGGQQGITLDKMATYLYQNMAFLLCFLAPLLTMRLFAEEKRQSTLELLFTSPIREIEIVLGKFFSAYLLVTFMVAISLIYVFFMMLWGNPEVMIIATTYLGLMLSLACYISIGALISAMTSSQAVAAVWTFIVLLMLWLLQSLGQGITMSIGPVQLGTLMVYISPLGHFSSFSEGLIHVKDVVYFITFTTFILFLTQKVVESNRWR